MEDYPDCDEFNKETRRDAKRFDVILIAMNSTKKGRETLRHEVYGHRREPTATNPTAGSNNQDTMHGSPENLDLVQWCQD